MNTRINLNGLIISVFFGFLAAALGVPTAWAVVIGIGTLPVLIAVVSVFIWLLERPALAKLDRKLTRFLNDRRRAKEKLRLAKRRAEMEAKRGRS